MGVGDRVRIVRCRIPEFVGVVTIIREIQGSNAIVKIPGRGAQIFVSPLADLEIV